MVLLSLVYTIESLLKQNCYMRGLSTTMCIKPDHWGAVGVSFILENCQHLHMDTNYQVHYVGSMETSTSTWIQKYIIYTPWDDYQSGVTEWR